VSITLTDRDAGTLVLNAAQVGPSGPTYSVTGATPDDNIQFQARFTNARGATGKSRSNLHGERKVRDANGKVWTLTVDTTISRDNGSPFTIDQIDDLVSAQHSYFSSEAITGDFAMGVPRF